MKQMMFSKSFAAKIATMALFLGMAQGISAQQFTAKIPATNRFVKITSDGVNVRRLPNATSGKVMTWNSDGGSIDTYTKIYFSDTEGKLYRANSMTGAYVESFHPAKIAICQLLQISWILRMGGIMYLLQLGNMPEIRDRLMLNLLG